MTRSQKSNYDDMLQTPDYLSCKLCATQAQFKHTTARRPPVAVSIVQLLETPTFAVANARLWNSMPSDIVASDTLPRFQRELKTILFRHDLAFSPWLTILFRHDLALFLLGFSLVVLAVFT